MSIQFTDREIQIATRWTEVHALKLFSHLNENPLLDPNTQYEFHSRVSVIIHTMKENERDREGRIRIIVFLAPYQHDKFFSCILSNATHILSLHNTFKDALYGPIQLCMCGRLGITRFFREEEATCDNCYIYGFVRGEECSICKDDDGKPWLKTSCDHHFHDMCWYRIRESEPGVRKCPLCRSEQYKDSITKL